MCIRGRPVRVVESDTVKGGKHGHCKTTLTGEDILTGKKLELAAPSSYGLPCPVVVKSEYLLMDVQSDATLSLLDDDNELRADLNLPLRDNEALARAIRAHFDAGKSLIVVTTKAMGEEHVTAFKLESSSNACKYESHGR